MMEVRNLRKYYRTGKAYDMPNLPARNPSYVQHFRNVRQMYETSIDYRISLPSFHIGYDYATDKLLEIADIHGLRSKTNLLELGCNFGTTLIRLARNYSFKVMGIDFVQKHIEECRRRIEASNLRQKVSVKCCNIAYLTECDIPACDVIFSEDTFSHIPKRKDLVTVCYSMLKPGGLLVFSDLVRTDAISQAELDDQCRAWCLAPLEEFAGYLQIASAVGFNILHAEDRLGKELLEYHVRSDMARDDADPRQYLETLDHGKELLIDTWGQRVFELRRQRLLSYQHIWEEKLDYAFYVLCK